MGRQRVLVTVALLVILAILAIVALTLSSDRENPQPDLSPTRQGSGPREPGATTATPRGGARESAKVLGPHDRGLGPEDGTTTASSGSALRIPRPSQSQRYGPQTVPAERSPQSFGVDHADPRPAGHGKLGGVLQSQNRVFLSQEEHGEIRVWAADGAPPIRVREGTLYRLSARAQPTRIGSVVLKDDGRSHDLSPSDGVYGAVLVPSKTGVGAHPTRLLVVVPVVQGPLTVEAEFQFEYTGAAPAEILGVRGATMRDGSLVFTVAVRVGEAGPYRWRGRLVDDSAGPVALLDGSSQLDVGEQEVELVAHGLLLRDRGLGSSLVLRDIEGWRLRRGAALPKDVVVPWREEFAAPALDPAALAAEPWQPEVRMGPDLPTPKIVPARRR